MPQNLKPVKPGNERIALRDLRAGDHLIIMEASVGPKGGRYRGTTVNDNVEAVEVKPNGWMAISFATLGRHMFKGAYCRGATAIITERQQAPTHVRISAIVLASFDQGVEPTPSDIAMQLVDEDVSRGAYEAASSEQELAASDYIAQAARVLGVEA